MKIQYKKTALTDIQEAEWYVSEKLHNPSAAKKQTQKIVQAVSQLAQTPYMGTPLNSRYDVDTDMRYLVVSKHLIFYRVIGKSKVVVERVLNGRQDYMSVLF